jgi:hypothetical protein
MISTFGHVFGGEEQEDSSADAFKFLNILEDFDQEILEKATRFCPSDKFREKAEEIDKKNDGPKWILCVPVNSLDEAFNKFANDVIGKKKMKAVQTNRVN